MYTVTWQYIIGLHGKKVNGTLVPSESVDTKHDMIINIALANNG